MRRHEIASFGKPLITCSVADPEPGGTEVVLNVERCGICHSDLHMQDGFHDLGGGKRMTLAERNILPPLVVGHEVVGRLSATGPSVSPQDAAIGKRYLVYPWIGCGQCYRCLDGDEHLCVKPSFVGVHRPGGQAEKILLPHPRHLVEIGNMDGAQAAALACSGLTSFSALEGLSCDPARDWLLLMGGGGLGQSAYALARALGYRHIAVADISPDKRRIAAAKGADLVINPNSQESLAQLSGLERGIAAVVDFVGNPKTAELSLSLVRRGGEYVIVGMYGGEISLSLPLLPVRSVLIRGAYVGNLRQLKELVALVSDKNLNLVETEVIPFEEVNSGLDRLRQGRVDGRLVLAI